MTERQQQLMQWAAKIEAIVEEMRIAEGNGMKSRQQSLAITKLEEGSHWLTAECSVT